MIPKDRRKKIRDAALGANVGRFVDEIEKALDGHVDLGRDPRVEAKALLREVVEAIARQDLGDKVVFLDTGMFETDSRPKEEPDDEWPDQLPRAARDSERLQAPEDPTG